MSYKLLASSTRKIKGTYVHQSTFETKDKLFFRDIYTHIKNEIKTVEKKEEKIFCIKLKKNYGASYSVVKKNIKYSDIEKLFDSDELKNVYNVFRCFTIIYDIGDVFIPNNIYAGF